MADELRKPCSVIRFNPLNGQLERPTLLLKTKSGELLGELQYTNLNLSFVGKGLNEISFDVHKSVNGKECEFWERIRDLCTVDFVGFGQFEASVSTDDTDETIKTLTCESLETELGQRKLYEFHVNDEDAIILTDGKFTPTVLCNFNDTEHSLLHRALKEKAPHWSVGYVSPLFNINGRVYNRESVQRTFTVDGTAIYDLFENEVSQECCCVFTYDTYDRIVNCHNLEECVYDGKTMEVLNNYYSIDGVEFYEIIYNKDGSRNDIKLTDAEVYERHLIYLNGIGEDTSIFVSKNKLSRSFTINSDKGSIKNCFRVTGGDDVITNRVAAANLSGNNYIYIFGNFQYEDMSNELVEKIKSYMELLESKEKDFTDDGGIYILDKSCTYKDGVCYDENNFVLPTAETDGTNVFVLDPFAYYKDGNAYDKDDNVLNSSQYIYKDTAGLYTQYCQLLDRISYVEHSKFPNTENETTATKEKEEILNYFSSNNVVSKTRWSKDSYSHVTGNIEDMIGVICDNRYKIKMLYGSNYPTSCTFEEIKDENSKTKGKGVWKGYVSITREIDEKDTEEFELTVNVRLAYDEDDLELCRQKIEIAIASMDIANLDFTSFYEIGKGTLVTEDGIKEVDIYTGLADLLRQYNYTSVSSFIECFDTCRCTLDDQYSNLGIEESDIPPSDALLISRSRYTIRYNTAMIVSQEIKSKLDELINKRDSIDKQIQEFRADLDMQTYFGTELWNEFQCYIREDEYNNKNYISDGLSDSEIMLKCKELLDVAKEELSKACNIQYQISGDLNNIFAINELKKLHDKFAIFNYVRSQVDDKIYKLRLMQIDFSDSSPESLNVTFSEHIERVDGKTSDIENILNSAQSIAKSYSSTVKQSKQGATALNNFNVMKQEGLDSSLYTVRNNRTTTSFDDTGIHCKSVLDSGIFGNCMLNVNANGVYMTTDAWESVKTAIGKFKFNDQWVYGVNTELLIGNMIVGKNLLISNKNENGESSVQIDDDGITIKNGLVQSANYIENESGSMLDLTNGTFNYAGGKLTYDEENGLVVKGSGTFSGTVSGGDININDNFIVDNNGNVTSNGNASFAGGDFVYNSSTSKLTVTGDITATTLTATQSGKIAGFSFNGTSLYTETNTTFDSTTGLYFGNNGLRLGNGFKVNSSGSSLNIGNGKLTYNSGVLTVNGVINADGGTFKNTIDCSQGTISGATISGGNIVNESGNYKTEIKNGQVYTHTLNLKEPANGGLSPAIYTWSSNLSTILNSITLDRNGAILDSGVFQCDELWCNDIDALNTITGYRVYSDSVVMGTDSCRPIDNHGASLGTNNIRWDSIFAKDGEINYSDRNLKEHILPISKKYESLFDKLKPVTYKFKDGTRNHYGFISQDVEQSMMECGLNDIDCAAFCKDIKTTITYDENGKEIEQPVYDEEGNLQYIYSLRYSEFIALNTHMIQKTRKENEELKQQLQTQQSEIDSLKESVSILLQQYNITQEQN